MGLFSFLKKDPQAQVEKARKLLATGEFARARNLVDGLEGDESQGQGVASKRSTRLAASLIPASASSAAFSRS